MSDRSRPHASPPERCAGQATTLLLAVVAIIVVVAVVVAQVGGRMVARHQAHAAADAAALAGTTTGLSGARRLAEVNGARLVAFFEHDDEVTVTVEVHGQRATARASDGP